jgi:hypothetical protein
MKTLEQLEKRKEELEYELRVIREKIEAEHSRIAKDKYGVDIGTIVVSYGTEYMVTAVRPAYCGEKPWLTAKPMKKDGTFGSTPRTLYGDWELKK